MEHEVFIYEAFPYSSTSIDERLKLRFKKLHHGLILKEKTSKKSGKKKTEEGNGEKKKKQLSREKWFRPFGDISGYCGVSQYDVMLNSVLG